MARRRAHPRGLLPGMNTVLEEFRPSAADEAAAAPSQLLAAWEVPRVVASVELSVLSSPLLRLAPRGDGHPVLVLPGLMAGDLSTLVLRRFLRRQGFHPYRWHLGRNVGPTAAVRAELPAAIERIARRNRSTVSVVGWSLGGIFARDLAHRFPEHVRQVVTLASPYRLRHPGQSRANGAFYRYSHLHVRDEEARQLTGVSPHPLSVPSTSIYSRMDGVVAWQHCIEPEGERAENIRVRSSHLGIGFDPHVLYAVADRLAQPEGKWAPFVPPKVLAPLFPPPDNPHEEVLDE